MRFPGPNWGRAPGDSWELRRAIVLGSPPLAGCRTTSNHSLRAQSRPRNVAPAPRENESVVPSALHVGFKYSPGSLVICFGSPPSAETFQSCPCLSSFQLVKAIVFPSGDQAGENSLGANESVVSRFGLPVGRSIIQSLPMA